MRWMLGLVWIITFSSYAGVNAKDCIYAKRGNHSVQERGYDGLLASLGKTTKEKNKRRRKGKSNSKGLK